MPPYLLVLLSYHEYSKCNTHLTVCILSVYPSIKATQDCLSLVLVMQLPDCGTLVLQVEQCGRFLVMREMWMWWSSFQMEIDLELAQMMELAGYLTSGLGTSSKYITSNMVITTSHLWKPLHSQYQEGFSSLDTQTGIAMYGILYWQRYL